MHSEYRVWWIPNPPRKPFYWPCLTIIEAKHTVDLLSQYDLYLGDDVIVANACGVEHYEDGEWEELDREDWDTDGA